MKLVYKDAEIDTNWNATKFDVKCRGWERKNLTQQQLIETFYPFLDAAAKADETSDEVET